ncbi:MAG: putative polymerase subfamily sigma factor [Gemmatimonadetes bacterium]|nr:putative polymerase subfamily sigma factor [Gemmatimonadota bacterium]
MTPEDAARFREGTDELFAALVTLHSPRLLSVALRLTGDRAAAHDLVHNAWVQAFYRRAQFAGAGSFLGWMLTVMRSCYLDLSRAGARRRARDDAFARDPLRDDRVVHAEGGAGELPTDEGLLAAIAELTDRQRDVITLRVIDGRSIAETAEQLGIAAGTVKATQSQALGRMRSLLRK